MAKAYETPKVKQHGDLKSLTLGLTLGGDELFVLKSHGGGHGDPGSN